MSVSRIRRTCSPDIFLDSPQRLSKIIQLPEGFGAAVPLRTAHSSARLGKNRLLFDQAGKSCGTREELRRSKSILEVLQRDFRVDSAKGFALFPLENRPES